MVQQGCPVFLCALEGTGLLETRPVLKTGGTVKRSGFDSSTFRLDGEVARRGYRLLTGQDRKRSVVRVHRHPF